MSKTYDNVKVEYFKEGIIRSEQMDDTISPADSVELSVNGNFDRISAFVTRKGISSYATALAGAVITLGKWSENATTNRRLLAQVGTDISSWNGTNWTSVRTLTSSNKVRYAQFLNYTYVVNGSGATGDAIQTFNGTSFSATNVGSLPKGDYVQAGFEGRVWVADKITDRLYYSNVVTPLGVIGGGTDYVEKLSPQDGQQITGLFRVPRALLVFKENSIFRVYGATSLDPYPAYNIGTYSQESIVQAKDGVYFHHSSGFYKFSYDGQPTEISRRIKDFVVGIPRTSYENVTGMYDGKDAIVWSVGDITVTGVRFRNCMLRYSISTQVWTVYDLTGSNEVKSMMVYDDGTNLVPIIGISTGAVAQFENGTTDLGLPIYYELITRWMGFTEMWSMVKNITGIYTNCENGAGGVIQCQYDKDFQNVWTDIGTFSESLITEFPNFNTANFNRIRFRIKGTNTGVPIVFHGIEIAKVKELGFNQN